MGRRRHALAAAAIGVLALGAGAEMPRAGASPPIDLLIEQRRFLYTGPPNPCPATTLGNDLRGRVFALLRVSLDGTVNVVE